MVISINLSPTVPPLPKFEDKRKVDVRYVLIAPYVSAHIHWNSEIGELVYEVEEPTLNDYEKDALKRLEEAMMELININVAVEKDLEATTNYIDKTARLLIDELNMKISPDTYNKIFYYLFRDFIGLNEIDPLLRDYYIEDVECNGIETPLYIIHRVYRNMRTNLVYKDIDRLANFVEKLAQRTGRYVSYAQPLLDGTLPDGNRVNATYTKDITSKGPTFCFKKGYVQLSDGRIEKIDELFENAKKNFGSKIEDGNEIINVSNINCCGVDEKSLEQKDSRIKSIIKMKAPEKLVKVEFEDGGDIEVTTNHLFHVAEESLKLVQAQDLKEGMLVPIPKKVNISGYKQKIDVYSLIKDFSYCKKICITSSKKIKEIVASEIQTFEKNGPFRQILSQKYGVSGSYFYEIMSRGNSISFEVLDALCQSQSLSFEDLGEIAINVYGGGTKGKTKSIMVPKEIDEDLAYLTGVLISDGHLSENYIDFCSYEEGVRMEIKEKLLKKFGRFDSYYNGNRIYLCNVFAPFFFNRIFGIPIGKKARTVKIPEAIFKSDNKIIAAFLKGLFDGDGTASAGLSYKTYSKELAEGLSYLLSRLGIYSYLRNEEHEYRLNIPSPYYKDYAELIGFGELKKAAGLRKLMEKQGGWRISARHDRIPGEPLLSIIRKLGINRKEILRNCGVSFNRIYYVSFSRDFARKLVNEVLKRPDANKVKEEVAYILWLLKSEQEFIKIKSVNLIDNKEPVYDIELEPCKFFVAGNKPMNIFDTIRKFTKTPWTPTQLISFNTVSPEMLAYFWILLQYKSNILIAGGTASGKTTFLNALAFFIPPEARVVSLEDTREINLPRENWLPAVTRPAIGIGKIGEVDLFAILKNSFRQNPDYLIVGEIRGKEAFVLFQGMASLPGDEKILVLNSNERKMLPIEKINHEKCRAICIDPKTEKVEIQPIQALIKHPERNELVKIRTKSGREVIISEDHSLFTYDKNIQTIEARNLKIGDCVVVPARIPVGYNNFSFINLIDYLPDIRVFAPEYVKKAVEVLGYEGASKIAGIKSISDYYANFKKSLPSSLCADKFISLMKAAKMEYDTEKIKVKFLKKSKAYNAKFEISNEFLRLLGYYISEGSLNNSGKNSRISLYAKDEEIISDMTRCIKAVGCEPRKRICKGLGTATELSFSHKVLFEFLLEHCGKGSVNKRIPNFIFGLSKEKIGEFLFALYQGDGGIRRETISYYTISKQLANDLSYLLLGFGIIGHIFKRGRSRIGKHESYSIKIYRVDDKKEFLKYAKIADSGLLDKILKIKGKQNQNIENDIYLDSVKSIEKIKLENAVPIYDISVPGKENFIGGFGGVLLHNSGHASLSTMHADSVDTLIRRLETPPIELSPTLVNTLDCVAIATHATIGKKETRRIREVVEIVNVDKDGTAIVNTPFTWDAGKDVFFSKKKSKVLEKISVRHGIPLEKLQREMITRAKLLFVLYKKGVFGFEEMQAVINDYYKNPVQVLMKYGIKE